MTGKKTPNNSGLFGLFGNEPVPSRSSLDGAANSLRWTDDKNKNIKGLGQRIDGHDKEIVKMRKEINRIKRNTIDSIEQTAVRVSRDVKAVEIDLQAQGNEVKNAVGAIREELSSDRYRTIEVLAFFVAFFTFVSVEFQLFATITNFLQVASLTLILFGCMVFFVVVLSRMATRGNGRFLAGWKTITVSIFFIIAGAVMGVGSEKLGWAQSSTEKFVDTKAQQCEHMMERIGQSGAEGTKQYNAYFALGCNEIGIENDGAESRSEESH